MPQDAPLPKPRSRAEMWKGATKEEAKPAASITDIPANALRQLWDVIKGIGETALITAPKSIYEFGKQYKDWDLLVKNPGLVWDELKKTGKAIGDLTVEPYEKAWRGDWSKLIEEPLTPVVDALTILSLGGGAIAKAGRLGGGLSKIERLAKGIESGGAAGKFVDVGEALKNVGPKLGRKLIEWPQEMMGLDPKMRSLLRRKERDEATLANAIKRAASEDMQKVLAPLNDVEKKELFDVLVKGSAAEIDAASPRVAAARIKYRDWVRRVREATVGEKGRRLLTDDEMVMATAKKRAAYTGETAKEAFDAIKAMHPDHRPVYLPFGDELDKGIFELIFSETKATPPVKKGFVSWLERYRGGKTKLPIEQAIFKSISDFVDVEARFRFLDRLAAEGLIKPMAPGMRKISDLVPVSDAIFKRYFKDKARAQGLAAGRTIEGKSVQEAERLLLSDPVTRKYVKSIAGVGTSDATVASYLKWAFYKAPEPFAKFIRLYDRLISLFKKAATVWNPRWYTGNIVGDAILSVAAGEYGLSFPLMKRVMDHLPASVGKGGGFTSAEILTTPKWRRYADIADEADQLVRAGLATQEMARQYKQVGAAFTASEQTLEDFIRAAGSSVKELSDIQVKVQLLNEHIARNSTRIGTLQRDIQGLERRLGFSKGSVDKAKLAANKSNVRLKLLYDQLAELRSTAARVREAVRAEKAMKTGKGGRILERFQTQYRQQYENLTRQIKEIEARSKKINKRLAEIQDQAGIEKGLADLQQKRAIREGLIAEMRGKLVETGDYYKLIPEARKYYEVAQKAVDRANAFLGDYWGLGPIERGVFRRVLPFYTWTKAMNMLAFQLPFIAPKSAFFWHKYAQTMASTMGDSELPEYMAPYFPTHVNAKGETIWLKFTGLSPFGSLRQGSFGGVEGIPSMLEFWKQNPIMKLGYRLAGGRDEFYWAGKPTDGEVWVQVGDGSVDRLRGGKIENAIPQAPLLKSVAYTFPVVQMAHQLISDYDVNRGPVLNPDGTVKYPKELWQRLLRAWGPTSKVADREELIRFEKLRERTFLRELKKLYKRAGPGERDYIRSIFEQRRLQGRFRLKAGG